MNNNEFQTIGLYEHNAYSYKKVKSAFETGKDVVGIVHATGTGKSYNALQLAYDNQDKKVVYVVPSNGIIEHIKKIIEDNPNLDLKRDFPSLELRTYQSFISLDKKAIASIDCDLLILDEFHHIGAPIWGARINTMIETHPAMKIFGMTAYTVRDRGTSYERDMVSPDTDELFSGKVESRYDLCDAMIDGILPKPVYKSAYTNLIDFESQLEEKVQKLGVDTKEYQEYMAILNDAKKRIHEAPSIPDILRKSVKPNGKYIYFCPPCSEEGANDIETIKKQAIEWFKQFVPEEDIIIYTSTSDMGEDGKKNRDAFYRDVNLDGEQVNNKLRVMFAINQYNEGIHVPNIDGVIMGRGTASDIVYFEQLGRALSVRGDTKSQFDKLEQYSIEQLISMCKEKDIPIKENLSKEDLIEKIIAPVVIDLTNNYDFIKELENNLKDRIKDIKNNDLGNHHEMKIKDVSFDIEMENQDLFEMLRYVMDRITMTWDDYYELAKEYYNHHGNLEIPLRFKTVNGFNENENGVKLGRWIQRQRQAYTREDTNTLLSSEQIEKLNQIEMIFDVYASQWMKMYNLAKAYYEHYGNLNISAKFKTSNGYDKDENGIKLGRWIQRQRQIFRGNTSGQLDESKINLLKQIGMNFEDVHMTQWMNMYESAKAYYEQHGNLNVSSNYIDEKGVKLGSWIQRQRQTFQGKIPGAIDENKVNLLKQIGMNFEDVHMTQWMKMYESAKAYYEQHGDLNVSRNYIDEKGRKLGRWIQTQRQTFKENVSGQLDENKINLLKQIGMNFEDINMTQWMNMYESAKAYYKQHGNLNVSSNYIDEKGVKLGSWIQRQRQAFKGKVTTSKTNEEKIKLLDEIGMKWFGDKFNKKLMKEQITSENLKRKKAEIQNRFYSTLNSHDGNTLVSSEELNQEFLEKLDTGKKSRG